MTQSRSTLVPTRAARRLAAATGVAAACATAALIAGCGGDSSASGYKVRAIFSNASFVQSGLDVRVAGVTVGAVDDVGLTDDNRAAVTFSITDPGFQDFRKDATCTIRPQALIGERYIECDLTEPRPAGATAPPKLPAIADGEFAGEHLLPEEQTIVPVDSDQLLNVNTPSVRDRFGIIIRELGVGVAGRGDEIAEALRKGNEGLTMANRILRQLDEDTEMLKGLVSTSDQTLATLAGERDSISGTIENGAVVARRLSTRKNEVKASIAALNDAFKEISPSVDRVTELTDELQPIADDLNRSAPDLATVFNTLPELSQRGSTAVTSLSPTLSRGTEVLTSDTTDTLFKRLVRTSGAVKASASVLGLTLGDFRSTGGLDFVLDSIYGLAYTTNGRDASGAYVRGAVINAISCILPTSGSEGGCGRRLGTEAQLQQNPVEDADDGSAARASAASSSGSAGSTTPTTGTAAKVAGTSPSKTSPSKTTSSSTSDTPAATSAADAERTAADLLLGGSQ